MKSSAAAPDGHALAAHYEALRQAVVDAGERGDTMRGRALLMRKGMALWMNGIDAALPQAAAPTAASAERSLPSGVEQHLVDILATMALASTVEVVA